jgi:hypothetical protein
MSNTVWAFHRPMAMQLRANVRLQLLRYVGTGTPSGPGFILCDYRTGSFAAALPGSARDHKR